MKRGFFLIEVIISIVLISGLILTLFQIKENNLSFLEKHQTAEKLSSFISLMALNSKQEQTLNKTVYLSDIITFKDDNARKELKNIKVKISQEKIDATEIKADNFSINVDITENRYSVGDKTAKPIYTIKLN